MFKVFVDYPSYDEEKLIAMQTTGNRQSLIKPVLTAPEILELQHLVREVPITEHLVDYALALVRQTRIGQTGVPDFVNEWLSWGAGPRAVQYLILGSKARALLKGRTYVSAEDLQALATPVLRHRIVTNFSAESEGITTDKVIEKLIEVTPSKEGELTSDPRLRAMFAAPLSKSKRVRSPRIR